MNRVLMICLLLFLGAPLARSDDDTWHNIYHSLKRFFTGRSSPTPAPVRHHRPPRAPTQSKTESPAEASPSPTPTPRVVVLPEASPGNKDTQFLSPTPTPLSSPALEPKPSPTPSPVLVPLPGPGGTNQDKGEGGTKAN